jgi:diadenosine tetraphosphate (Ap4A) HIT family hydrolase
LIVSNLEVIYIPRLKRDAKEEIYKAKFMEWGIISKENWKGKTTFDLPIKRWDPLSTVKITSEDFGLRKGQERYYGHYSYISPIRGTRPKGFKTKEEEKEFYDCSEKAMKKHRDVFSSVTEGEQVYDGWGMPIGDGFTVLVCQDEMRRDTPFLETPHQIERVPGASKALTLINRYPSMARIVDSEVEQEIKDNLPPQLKLSRGINLVTISRHFYPSMCFNLIPPDVLVGIFISMKAAILYCVEEAINRDYYDIPCMPFFNIGKKVGGSQPRIHSQTYIDLNMDGHGSRLEGYLEAFKEMGDDCHLCRTTHGGTDRIILNTEFWTFYNTGSPVRNYHIRFHPTEHLRRFSQLKINQIEDLAHALKIIFQALDDIEIDKNRNILFNCCPYGYDADFHMFADIIPHEIIGGAEMADDMRVARKLPHIAASEIRKSLEKYLN